MRCYHFCNFYLSQIQHGIQSAHCQMTMFTKYRDPMTTQYDQLYRWATNHKTMICLNGGYSSTLVNIHAQLEDLAMNKSMVYPFAKFEEEFSTLNCATTNVCIVLPEYVYNSTTPDDQLTNSADDNIVRLLRSCKLI